MSAQLIKARSFVEDDNRDFRIYYSIIVMYKLVKNTRFVSNSKTYIRVSSLNFTYEFKRHYTPLLSITSINMTKNHLMTQL